MSFLDTRIQRRVVIDNISLTANEWDLFTSEQGVDEVAVKINEAVKEAVNNNPSDGVKAAKEISEVLWKYKEFGAGDSEPRWMLKKVLRFIYGDNQEYV